MSIDKIRTVMDGLGSKGHYPGQFRWNPNTLQVDHTNTHIRWNDCILSKMHTAQGHSIRSEGYLLPTSMRTYGPCGRACQWRERSRVYE